MIAERATSKVVAPFTPEQVRSLTAYQQSGAFHEFTCGNDSCRARLRERAVLVATREGWHCPALCGYKQNWAHTAMADWSWKRWQDITVQVDNGPPVKGEIGGTS